MSKIKYAVFPGAIRSQADGDIHFIGTKQLIDLYGVRPDECLIIDIKKISHSEYRRSYHLSRDLIQLHPRMDGNYTLSEPTKKES